MPPKSGVVKRIEKASELICSTPLLSTEITFTPRELVQATLPHRDPGNVPVWQRRNGNYGLVIQPGWDIENSRSIGYPYGTIPRLIIFWLTVEALRTHSKIIKLGDTFSDFLRKLGLDPDRGGKCSDSFRVKDQAKRLLNAKISFQHWGEIEGKRYQSYLNLAIAERTIVFWEEKDKTSLLESGGIIELTDKFYQAITENPVPLDIRALRALHNSPLAIDVYSWATLRAYACQQKNKSHFAPWGALLNQFGTGYSNSKDFKKYFKIALEKVQVVYPTFKFEYINGGINVLPCSPAVIRKSSPRKHKPELERTAGEVVPASDNKRLFHVSSGAIENARILIANAGTGWCKYALEQQFYDYAAKNGKPKEVDAAFIGFVKKKIKKKP